MTREGKQDRPWGHFFSEFCAAANPSPAWTHSPTDTQVELGWCRAYSPHSADTEPARSFSGRVMVTGNWQASSTMKEFFFPAISWITFRAFWLDWNFCRRVLYMLSPSLCPSVCMVSLKIAIFLVKPCNCQRTSCVCVYNASSVVIFLSFYFSIATVFIARMWQNKYLVKGKGKRCFPHMKGQWHLQALTSARILHFMPSAHKLVSGFEICNTMMLCNI